MQQRPETGCQIRRLDTLKQSTDCSASIAEGDRVVIRFTSSGTQRGAFAGMAPNGKKVTIHEAAIYKVVAGKIVEQWGFPDSQSLMQQLMAPATGR